MPYLHEVRVADADIDNLGHASNLAYLRWVQEAALAHSSSVGFPEGTYLARGQAWVVRRHEIEYVRPALPGDTLTVETRVANMKAANSERLTRILRGNELLCRATTDWVYIHLARARPIRIPEDVKGAFPLEP
ncbi:MAG TPA: thioesterase family protein [Myxococcales bacterium]|jgi:acyl-CoA thioester hydrolase|nr:thioesterase family protein [Myxococcales bacterium]